MKIALMLTMIGAAGFAQTPTLTAVKPTAKIESALHSGGGAITTRYSLIGKFSRRLNYVEVYAAWVGSSVQGPRKGMRIQIICPDTKLAGEIWIDEDELQDLESALSTAAKDSGEAFFAGRGGARIGKVRVVDKLEGVLQRDSWQDGWISLDAESFGKFAELVHQARAVLTQP